MLKIGWIEAAKKPQKKQKSGIAPDFCLFGAPNGIRTRVTALKGLCPRPLDDGDCLCSHPDNGGDFTIIFSVRQTGGGNLWRQSALKNSASSPGSAYPRARRCSSSFSS